MSESENFILPANNTLNQTYGQKNQRPAVNIIHKSEIMQNLLKMVDRVAQSSANILILGESGTGKELIAKTIHEKSQRKFKPFVAINCGALREALLESELFGHEEGAFTGAYARTIG